MLLTGVLQDLVMAARGKLKERNWRRGNGDPATIDDITVLVIPILPYKQEQVGVENDVVETDVELNTGAQQVVVEVVGNRLDEGMEAMEVEKEVNEKDNHTKSVDELVGENAEVEVE